MKTRYYSILSIITGIITSQLPYTALFAQNFDELDTFIENARMLRQVPGVAVSIVQGNKVVYAKGFGVIRITDEKKVDENTIFQLASISKTFTAAALGIQADKGLLDWDEEIIQHLPQFVLYDPYPSRYVTARDLLAHRTGLPAFGGDLLGKLGYTADEILYRIRFISPATSFRNRAYYSNIGFFVAGELLQNLTQASWEETIRTALLLPLGMQRSGFAANLDNANVAFAHARIDGEIKVIPWDRTGGFPAAGAITSTAADMAHWMTMLLNEGLYQKKQLLQSKTIQEMFHPSMVGELSFSETPPIDANSSFSFGLGWNNYNYKGRVIVEKGGGLDGIRTLITLIPELKLGITILSNLNLTLLPESIRAKFLELAIGKSATDIQAAIIEKEKELATLLQSEIKPANRLPLGHKLTQYTGTFESALYGTFLITKQGDLLIVKAGPGEWQGKLTHWSNDTFILQWPTINSGAQQITFTFGLDNQPLQFQTETLGTFNRVSHEN